MKTATQIPILLIEDTPSLAMVYRSVLTAAGYQVGCAASHAQGWTSFQKQPAKVVLLDLMLPDGDGLSLMQDMLRLQPDTRVIVITAHGSVATAVEAMRAGAFEFLVKPFAERRMLEVIADALQARRATPDEIESCLVVVAQSASGVMVRNQMRAVANSAAPVFITGEVGTGKCSIAREIHTLSERANFPFITVSCGKLRGDILEVEIFGARGEAGDKIGLAEAAHGGTLYFDEVAALPDAVQTRLLRLLQSATVHPVGAAAPVPVNVRLICATSGTLAARGQLRDELFFRLHVLPMHLSPLRQRPDDIVLIAQAALKRYAQDAGRPNLRLSPSVIDLLTAHSWPGNVRELLNLMRSITVMQQGHGIITPEMLPAFFSQGAPQAPHTKPMEPCDFAGLTMVEIERRVIEAGLVRHKGSVPRTARELDIAASTLYRKLDTWAKGG